MKAGRVFDIGMPERYSDQIVPFEVDDVPVEFFGDHQVTGNLTGETRIPERRKELRRRLLRHDLDYVGCRNKAGARESLQNGTCAEEVVAVASRRSLSHSCRSPLPNPRARWSATTTAVSPWGRVGRDSGYAGRDEYVPLQLNVWSSNFSHKITLSFCSSSSYRSSHCRIGITRNSSG